VGHLADAARPKWSKTPRWSKTFLNPTPYTFLNPNPYTPRNPAKPGTRNPVTWQMEQDLGSCVFTVVYFIVYFVLHGPTLRLLIIGLIVLVQFSFQVYSKPEPRNSVPMFRYPVPTNPNHSIDPLYISLHPKPCAHVSISIDPLLSTSLPILL
jgi:hypothetical protein